MQLFEIGFDGLVDYLLKFPLNNEKLVDDAEVFITCELASNFLTTMKTLKDHFNNKTDTYVAMEKVADQAVTNTKVFLHRPV